MECFLSVHHQRFKVTANGRDCLSVVQEFQPMVQKDSWKGRVP